MAKILDNFGQPSLENINQFNTAHHKFEEKKIKFGNITFIAVLHLAVIVGF
jgi:hypothetical protein